MFSVGGSSTARPEPDHFTFLEGGLPKELPSRLHLAAPGHRGTVAQAVFLAAISWVPLVVANLIEYAGTRVTPPDLIFRDIEPHIRLLLALPLLVLIEDPVKRRLGALIRYLDASSLISADKRDDFKALLTKTKRRAESPSADLVLLALAVALAWTTYATRPQAIILPHVSWFATPRDGQPVLNATGWVYLLLSLPIYRMLVLRWLWRLALWSNLLWRLTRLPLRLDATHCDGAGGLDLVGRSQAVFTLVFASTGVSASGTLATSLVHTDIAGPTLAWFIGAFVVTSIILVLAPLLVFVPPLAKARRDALVEHGLLADALARDFEVKWIEHEPTEERFLGSPDPSAVADYGSVLERLRAMRVILVNNQLLRLIVAVLLLPFLPLLLWLVPLRSIVDFLLWAVI